jgi:hypothetical protein
MRLIKGLASALIVFSTAAAWAAGSVTGDRIMGIQEGPNGTLLVTFSEEIASGPPCVQDRRTLIIVRSDSPDADTARSAYQTGIGVTAWGTGSCDTYVGYETLRSLTKD